LKVVVDLALNVCGEGSVDVYLFLKNGWMAISRFTRVMLLSSIPIENLFSPF
jgi:hypothetical protein